LPLRAGARSNTSATTLADSFTCFVTASNGKLQHREEVPCGQEEGST
jgi:hypothetical protein